MRFGLSYSTGSFGTDPERLTAVARCAEECGFESFYLPEHMALHPGARVGEFEIPPATPIADPLECLAFVAASTSRVVLGTAVLLLPYHEPVVLAKRLATLDVLSAGRMRLLTIGVGGLPGEAAAVGVDYATRGRRTDEAMDALRALWAGDAQGATFTGQFFSFADVTSFPKPHDVDTLPIHVGGSSRAAARRAGLRGDGWFPGGWLPPQERMAQWELVRATAVEAGRDPERLDHTRWASLETEPSGVAAYAAQGVTRLVVGPSSADPDEQRRDLEAFATRHGMG
jgi:probable F420-dependent oxidoreductase